MDTVGRGQSGTWTHSHVPVYGTSDPAIRHSGNSDLNWNVVLVVVLVVVVAFSWLARIWDEPSNIHSPPALFFVCVCGN